MYTLKITDENTVVTTVKESIVERSNYVDKIQIITSKMYREQIDMSDTRLSYYCEVALFFNKHVRRIHNEHFKWYSKLPTINQ